MQTFSRILAILQRLLSRPKLLSLTVLALPSFAQAADGNLARAALVQHWTVWACLTIFLIAYTFVVIEEKTHLRKSVPMIIAAGVLWILVSLSPVTQAFAGERLNHHILEFAELFLFIFSAVTYVNTMEERQVFDVLRGWLVSRGLTLRGIFWVTGGLAFLMSPVADNLTTTLVMGAVATAVGGSVPKFIVPACINIVVAANAGGAFSPFGDITTLMVWQKGHVSFFEFFTLFPSAVVNWLVPAVIMARAVPMASPIRSRNSVTLLPGASVVIALFLGTIASTVVLHNFLHLPAAVAMMTGLGVLHLYAHFLKRSLRQDIDADEGDFLFGGIEDSPREDGFDVFKLLARLEWDTLLFFYGVILCVGALGTLGLLDAGATALYSSLGPTMTNTAIGVGSAVFDNIPLMAAVLTVNPELSHSQWLLITLTTGVGGSLLSVGSAAGVALMGQAKGSYTFRSHLKWTWAVALGFAASIGVHVLLHGF